MLTPVETALIAVLLIALMFGMGASLTVARFRDVWQRPRAFAIGTLSQFVVMPLLAYALAVGLELPNEAALGLVVMGMCRRDHQQPVRAPGPGRRRAQHRDDGGIQADRRARHAHLPLPLRPLVHVCRHADALCRGGQDAAGALAPGRIGMWVRGRFGERVASRAERIGSLCGLLVLIGLVAISVLRNAHLFATISASM